MLKLDRRVWREVSLMFVDGNGALDSFDGPVPAAAAALPVSVVLLSVGFWTGGFELLDVDLDEEPWRKTW